MTKEEFKEKMEEVTSVEYHGWRDTERMHMLADDLRCRLLEGLGYGDGGEVFRKLGKGYA